MWLSMRFAGTMGLCLFPMLTRLARQVTAHPDDPTITSSPSLELIQRQDDDDVGTNFIGYTSYFGRYIAQSCGSGSTVTSSSSWAACRPTEATTFIIATGCESESVLVAPNTEFPCGLNVCYSIFLYQSLDDETPHSLYACDSVSRDITLYAETTGGEEPSASAESTTSTEPTTTSSDSIVVSSTDTSTSSTSDSGESSTASSSTGSGSSSGSDSDSGSSRPPAWIAGPIVGGIAGVTIIALLIWIIVLLRKRRQHTSGHGSTPGHPPAGFYPSYQQQPPPGWIGQAPPPQFYQPGQPQTQAHYAPNVLSSPQVELHGTSVPTELQAESKAGHGHIFVLGTGCSRKTEKHETVCRRGGDAGMNRM
ncbi:hypothetical protein AK830_g3069 [Neonectria ditissima]|uniref:Mid2 domain-containing protein n=1 Tax=Neonectria ditissima TaxID=78410 RepID=A0A0P7BIQ1_9HYPO|nr:hypothetical protein AK830_g3069 [Neonectria ditissima]